MNFHSNPATKVRSGNNKRNEILIHATKWMNPEYVK